MKKRLIMDLSGKPAHALLRAFGTLWLGLTLLCGGPPASAGALADLEIVDTASGSVLPTYRHDGRLYVAGTPGARYAVRVANRAPARLLAVVAVDGVNVLSGETAAPTQSGYVFAAHERYDISGWRKSHTQTAAFYFTELPDSYAARTARGDQVGVIGVAVFREWTAPAPMADLQSHELDNARDEAGAQRAAPGAPAAAGALAQRERLGTGHGERLTSVVTHTEFRRASTQPDEVIAIHYDRREALVARGIVPSMPSAEPAPFPGGFVPDPGA
jgi:hypothetical protein